MNHEDSCNKTFPVDLTASISNINGPVFIVVTGKDRWVSMLGSFAVGWGSLV